MKLLLEFIIERCSSTSLLNGGGLRFGWYSLCRSLVAFGLNALYNRFQVRDGWGPWDSSNARSFIQFSIEQGIQVEAWELGNSLLC